MTFKVKDGIQIGANMFVDGSRNITSGTINGVTISPTTGTLTVASGKTLTANNTLTLTGTDASSVAFGTGGTVAYTGNTLNVFATTTAAQLADVIIGKTGSDRLVFGTSPDILVSLTTSSTAFDLINTTVTSVNFAKAATTLSIGAATGTTTVNNTLVVTGDLTVNGTTTTINTVNMAVEDISLELGKVGSPTDTTANTGGIILLGTTNKTILWDLANTNWTSSEHWNIATGKTFKINNVTVLSATQVLGKTIGGTAAGDIVNIDTAQTLSNKTLIAPVLGVATGTSFNAITGLASDAPLVDGTATVGTSTLTARQDHVHPTDTSRAAVAQTMFIGTTSVAINRASANLVLTGITSITGGSGMGVNLDSATTGDVNIGTGNFSKIVTIGNTAGVTGVVINTGSAGLTVHGTLNAHGALNVTGTAIVAGTFNKSATNPVGTTRLNYEGYFYPTFINLVGTGDTATAASHYFVETGSDGYVRPKTLADVKTEIVTAAAITAATGALMGDAMAMAIALG